MNGMFELLIGLEVAAIAAMLGVAFAPAAVWALFNRKPPHWTRAARSPSPVRARKDENDDPLALENFVGRRGAMKAPLPFGEMG